MKTRLAILVVLALSLAACGTIEPPANAASVPPPLDAPLQPGNAADDALVSAVRGFLHTFNLNEKDLKTGVSIPFGFCFDGMENRAVGGLCAVGTARATGNVGPQGHQVYDVIWLDVFVGGGAGISHRKLTEISPEPTSSTQ
jgi:hypothetical protein